MGTIVAFICGWALSGGVDSTTLSAILAPVLRERLFAMTIDGGHLRERELDEIKRSAAIAGVNLLVVDAREEFAAAMASINNMEGAAEQKRRIFKQVYPELFIRAAQPIGVGVAIQGTLAADVIESGATGGALIKSHHNVGLNMGNLEQLHPIDHLFKYEVRALAQEIGLPKNIYNRQPFPGPGLFIRVVGMPLTPESLDIVRWADGRVREILQKRGLYDDISHLVVAYGNLLTTGVKGDARAYKPTIVVRAVKTLDFMTARGVRFPDEVEEEIESVLSRHPEIGAVMHYPMSKPPATTELE